MTQPESEQTTVVSCPGKVLWTGGYLVLEGLPGSVLAVDARMYTEISPKPEAKYLITLESPQFLDAVHCYDIKLHPNQKKLTINCFQIIYEKTKQLPTEPISIIIKADNDFYSQSHQLEKLKWPKTSESLKNLEQFTHTTSTLDKVHKTGLGSSACLVSSMVGALLIYYKFCNHEQNEGLQLIHQVAQFCHCQAQGKIGSGFDVACAIYGSLIYNRFSAKYLEPLLSNQDGSLLPFLEQRWDTKITPFQLPPLVELVLADVEAGSHTPSMVSRLLQWKQANQLLALPIWKQLEECNKSVVQCFLELDLKAKFDYSHYQTVVAKLSQLSVTKWSQLKELQEDSVYRLFNLAFEQFEQIRKLFRQLTKLTQVPIEPESQSFVLDQCLQMPGVWLAGVPGAGGYDAISCLVLSKKTISILEEKWQTLEHHRICPLTCREGKEGGLKVEFY